jgi:hypothetical protein
MALDVLVLMTRPDPGGDELMKELSSFVPKGSLEAVNDVAALTEHIRKLRGPDSLAIIYNPANNDLRKIVALRDRFLEGRTLLILPDQEEETVALAHSLLPAFVTYVGDGNARVISVVKKLAGAFGEHCDPPSPQSLRPFPPDRTPHLPDGITGRKSS